jgi:hypothetical protein
MRAPSALCTLHLPQRSSADPDRAADAPQAVYAPSITTGRTVITYECFSF